MTWRESAACQGVDYRLFDHGDDRGPSLRQRVTAARTRYCNRCPVKDQCLTDGINSRAWGIWGGQLLDAGTIRHMPPPCGTEDAFDGHAQRREHIDTACRNAHAIHLREQREGVA